MRPALIFSAALFLGAPSLPDVGTVAEAASAQARGGAKGRSKKKAPRPARKPQIKLQEAPAPEPAPEQAQVPQRGPTRIDFDDRLVQGQTNKSGSVYLYDRKELKTQSMVKKRESFREQIVEAVYDAE